MTNCARGCVLPPLEVFPSTMNISSTLSNLVVAFVAGFLAVLVFHQATVAVLNALGAMPTPAVPWSLEPVPPVGVPTVISKAFWGGLWAMLFAVLLRGTRGAAFWGSWIALGAIALPIVAIFVVPPLKGKAPPDFWTVFPVYALINAIWGFGAALILRMLGRGGS